MILIITENYLERNRIVFYSKLRPLIAIIQYFLF